MSVLTLSPEERVYAVALVVLASVSASTLAGFVYKRYRALPALFLPIYAATMFIVGALAVILLDVPTVGHESLQSIALAVPAGMIACLIALPIEGYISRALRRRFGGHVTGRLSIASELVRPDLRSASNAGGSFALTWLLVVAVGEEMLFRGVLVDIARFAPDDAIRAALLAGFTIAFALSHGQLRFGEALAKLPLSITCLATYLVCGTLVGPIVAHAIYNAWMWRAATLRQRILRQAVDVTSIDGGKR